MSQSPEQPGKVWAHRPVAIAPTPEMKRALTDALKDGRKPSSGQWAITILSLMATVSLAYFAWQQSLNNAEIRDLVREANELVNSQTGLIEKFGDAVTQSTDASRTQTEHFGTQVQKSQTQLQKQMRVFSGEARQLGGEFRAAVSKLVEHSETQEQRAINKEIRELILEAQKEASACVEADVSVLFFLEEAVRLERRLAAIEQRLTPSQYFKLVYFGYGFLETQDLFRYCEYGIEDSATPLTKHNANLLAAHVFYRRHELGKKSSADMIEKGRKYFEDTVAILETDEMSADNHYFVGRAYELWAAHELYIDFHGTGLEDTAEVASEKSGLALEHLSKADAELDTEFCKTLAYTLERSKKGQVPKAPCMLAFARVPGFEDRSAPSSGYGSSLPGPQPTPAPAPIDPAPAPIDPAPPGFPPQEEKVEGKVVIENRTTRSVELCLNGLYYVLLPGRKEIWTTYGPVTAYLPRYESPKEYGEADWKWNRDHHELLLPILRPKDIEN